MSVEVVVANMLRIAKEDFDGARLLAAAGNRNAAYLCEQSAEKVIRAVLTSEGIHAGNKHMLDEMVDLVPDANPVKQPLRELEHLAAYATAYRYPTPAGRIKAFPSAQELEATLRKVAIVLEDVARVRYQQPAIQSLVEVEDLGWRR